jgi:conjugative transfer pilus assembly protein TraH
MNIRLAIALLFALLAAPVANAQGIDSGMAEVFNSQANVTQPGFVDGQYRGMITGGSVQVRNRIMNTTLVSFDPPRVSAGCGGLDLYGGSFSYINKEEFTALARSVASNAVGYAFQLALSSICQNCMAQIQDLREKLDKLNLNQLNSCEMAKSLVDGMTTKQNADKDAGQASADAGAKSDTYEASGQGQGESSPTGEVAKDAPEAAKKIIKNYVWEGIKKQPVGDWFEDADSQELREHLMSLIGTVVVCTSGESGCKATDDTTRKGDPVVREFGPTLRLASVVLGSDSDAGTVTILKCDEKERCLGVEQKEDSSFKGLRTLVLNALLGPEGERDTGGLIGIYVHGTSKMVLSPTQMALRKSRGDYVAMALRLASYEGGEPVARNFVLEFSDLIASEIAYDQTMQAIDGLEGTVMQLGSDPEGKVKENLRTARTQLQSDFQVVLAQAFSRANLLAVFKAREKEMTSRIVATPNGTRTIQ